ncbi:aminoglycoside 3'-phosphotransferase [Jiangella asiatica]|uniref:Aminoglycoside 3'-phosphotransferase n=1 Tax=Jiangella asiatica TaxID=2530372 RepID=A0A4R5DQN1_9ACTN|nr:APH(3') family aminoglycoside O-phosphotransferase [Jiangella asiatica]TDE15977.1 aminoglycoside 3'-phosphotransferase [Jiangella asiatica]
MWERVSAGQSGAEVSRRDGVFRKRSDHPGDDLVGEGERLRWLRRHGIPAAEVLECRPGRLVTAQVPGRSADQPWPDDDLPRVVDALADLTRALHAIPVAECPFDRRLATTVPAALSADPDLDDLDDERAGWTRDQLVAELLATRPDGEDLAVCHGDLDLLNVLLDPTTCTVTGVIDAGRLGVADRWLDLAVVTRSLEGNHGAESGRRFLERYGVAADPAKQDFYRLLDEFF